jgi:hypothetical protein
MTSEEQLELDQLKQVARTSEAVIKDLQGKLKAMELNIHDTRRNAEKTLAEAKSLREETEHSLDIAADQMRVAHSIGLGIFGMADLGRARIEQASSSARFVYREYHILEWIEKFLKAEAVGDQISKEEALKNLKEKVASVKHDTEANRFIAAEQYLAHGLANFERVWLDLLNSKSEGK